MQSSVSLLSRSSGSSDSLDRNGAHVPLDIHVISDPTSPLPQDKEAAPIVQDSCNCCQCKDTINKLSRLDLYYVNDRIISMGAPRTNRRIEDDTESVPSDDNGDDSLTRRLLRNDHNIGPLHERDKMILPSRPQSPHIQSNVGKELNLLRNNTFDQESHSQDPNNKRCTEKTQFEGNCPKRLSNFLKRRHANHYMVFNISSTAPSSRTLSFLNNQVVNLPWTCPGINASTSIDSSAPTAASIPTLKCLLDICYAIDAYIKLDEKNMAVVYCSNGKTRTGIAIAAYLKYAYSQSTEQRIYSSLEGFRLFCSRTCRDLVKDDDIDDFIPPSLKTLFGNFDALIECGGTIQKDPLVLRAVTLQGLPVEEMPRIDIWDKGGIIFSSHDNKEPTCIVKDFDSHQVHQEKKTLLWADDDAFYRVNTQLEGDFLLLCRFGGEYAHDTDDPTKVILRYANNTSFLFSAPYELPKTKVDIMRRYAQDVDDAEFLLTLLFDHLGADEKSNHNSQERSDSLSVLERSEALHRGWDLIHNFHSLSPDTIRHCNVMEDDLTLLQKYYHGGVGIETLPYPAPNILLLLLALQVSNGDLYYAVNELLEKSMKRMWKESSTSSYFSLPQLPRVNIDLMRNIPQCQASGTEFADEDRYIVQVTPSRETCNTFKKNGHGRANVGRSHNYDQCHNESSLLTILKEIESDSHIVAKYDSDSSSIDVHKRQLSAHVNDEISELRRHNAVFQGQLCTESLFSSSAICPQTLIISSDLGCGFIEREKFSHCNIRSRGNRFRLNVSHRDTIEHSMSCCSVGSFYSNVFDPDILAQTSRSNITADDLVHFINHMDEPQIINTSALDKKQGFSDTISQMKDRRRKLIDYSSLDSLSDQVDGHVIQSVAASGKILLIIDGKRIEGYVTSKDSRFYTVKIPTNAFVEMRLLDTNSQVVDLADSTKVDKRNEMVEATEVLVEHCNGNVTNESARNQDDSHNTVSKSDAITCGAIDVVAPHAMSKLEKESELSKDDLPLKDDTKYQKYFKMLKVGLPVGAVKNALQKDGNDPSIVDMDPNKSFKSQRSGEARLDVSLKDDPAYEKYFRMLKMGLPIGAVKNALQRDGKDPSSIDVDINQSAYTHSEPAEKSDEDDTALKDDPQYSKYFRMLKMGLPIGAVKNALQRDGKDPAIIDLDPDKSIRSQAESVDKVDSEEPKLQEDPEYSKYFRMLKMGLPIGAVKNALQRDGKDPSIIDLDPNKPAKDQMNPSLTPEKDTGLPLKDDPEYTKYFKMLKMGLPIGAVRNALQRDGKETYIVDLDPNLSLDYQLAQKNRVCPVDKGLPLKDDPEYQKYFKMIKMGLPIGAVQNALQRDGKDPSIIELNPNQSVEYQLMMKKNEQQAMKKEKKPKIRRKKIYWNAIDKSKLQKDSLWGQIRGMFAMEKLKIDNTEFESLFTETLDPSQKKKKVEKSKSSSVQQKKSVQVIEAKKGMNGGIILARIKMDFSELARIVDLMIYGKLDSTQLLALKQFLPTDDEAAGLRAYVSNAMKDEAQTKKLMNDLCSCEKYMLAMMEVSNAAEKFDSMLFQIQFKAKVEEINESISALTKACNDVKNSIRFRKLLAIILTIGNQINTGGDGNMAEGFTLDALLKLNEAKAFDKKTSVLQYVIKVINKNDPELLKFNDEIISIDAAKDVMLESVISDLKQIQIELEKVKVIAKQEGDKYRDKEGKLTNPDMRITLSQLKEQKTYNRVIDGVKFYNQMERDTEFTPMEMFTQTAEYSTILASDKIKDAREKFSSLLSYFGEDENMSTTDFFGTLSNFRKTFEYEKELYEKQEAIRIRDMKRQAKQKEERKSASHTAPTKHNSIPTYGCSNEAESTAAVVGKRNQESSVEDEGENRGTVASHHRPLETVPMDGIAAMAAAAAARKKLTQETTDTIDERYNDAASDQVSRKDRQLCHKGKSSIAAMAAAEAARKMHNQNTAAAAEDDSGTDGAAERVANKDGEVTSKGMGGIAAMAAAAARRKQTERTVAAEDECNRDAAVNPIGMGGIAAMAAAAAARKMHNQNTAAAAAEDDSGMDGVTERVANKDGEVTSKGTGGIAAMAAAAARRKQTEKTVAAEDECNRDAAVNPIGMGGIAAMTAAAAARKMHNQNTAAAAAEDNLGHDEICKVYDTCRAN